MKDEDKTKVKLLKELKILREERGKGVFKNIFEYKEAEKRLKESEEKHQELFENMMDGLVLHRLITDKNGHPVDYILEKVNKATEKILSWNRKDIEGKKATEVYSGDAPFIERYAKVAQTGKAEYFVDYYPRFKKWYEINSFCPKKGYFANVFRDITERKQAEENLKNIKDELQMIMDLVPAMITYKDKESRVIRANKTMANSLKMPVKDIVGKTTEELFPKKQAENMRKDDKEVIISGKPKRNIIQPYTTPEGIRWLITDKMPYKDKEGKVSGVIGLSKDITIQRKSEEELKQSYQRLKKTMDATIETMSKMIEAKDPYTSGHQHRVCQLAVPLARELGLPEDKIEGIRIASLIHDIGKIGLPSEILSKPNKLDDVEFSLIKRHSQIGFNILKYIDFLYPIDQIVLQHHERLNGSGYPHHLKGDKILLEAKIIGVADVVEAISSHRPYRPALGVDAALEEIIQNKGILYAPEVVDACLRLFKEKGFKFES